MDPKDSLETNKSKLNKEEQLLNKKQKLLKPIRGWAAKGKYRIQFLASPMQRTLRIRAMRALLVQWIEY